MPIKKKPAKKKSTKRKPRATMNQSVRQTVIVNQPTATRKRKSKAKPKSKSNNELISSLVDKFVNLSAEQAKINNTITQAKQPVKVEDIAPVKLLTSAPVQKTTGMDDLEVKKIKKAEPIVVPIPKPEELKRAPSLNNTFGNIFSHLSRKPAPKPPKPFELPPAGAQSIPREPSLDVLPNNLIHRPDPLLGKGGSKYRVEETKKDDFVMVDPLSNALRGTLI